MKPTQGDALGLGLFASLLGVLVSQSVITSARRSGLYRRGRPQSGVLSRANEPDAFFIAVQSWVDRARYFAVASLVLAVCLAVCGIEG